MEISGHTRSPIPVAVAIAPPVGRTPRWGPGHTYILRTYSTEYTDIHWLHTYTPSCTTSYAYVCMVLSHA